ncbi:MAG: GNAT family N-acetyltransferase [Nitrospira sp.]|jgi:GNAT superfamily N-acetyltransferase|nr:GNAT family N-acetyltransferase [Nitrospira sp.]ULA68142.1 MAG: GNAT family N-acetyltransferase [Nitrospira sp.]
MPIHIATAELSDAPAIARLVGDLLQEIMASIKTRSFVFSLAETEARTLSWLGDGSYTVLLARDGGYVAGLLALSECRALYAEGRFGIIPELYVCPDRRSQGVGQELVTEAKRVARSKGWARLEVTTPPLPQFDRTLAFYERQGFSISGGRKMKLSL